MSVEAKTRRASLAEIASSTILGIIEPLKPLNKTIVKEFLDLIDLSRTPKARWYQPGEGNIAGPLKTQAFIREIRHSDNIRLASSNLNQDSSAE